MCTAQKEKRSGFVLYKPRTILSYYYSAFFFHYRFFKQKEKSLITKILNI